MPFGVNLANRNRLKWPQVGPTLPEGYLTPRFSDKNERVERVKPWSFTAMSIRFLVLFTICISVFINTRFANGKVIMTDLGGGQYRVQFSFKPPEGTQTVALAGTFNGWNPRENLMTGPDSQGIFSTHRTLPKGRYEYKFVLDGKEWVTDSGNPYKTEGYLNAIVFAGVSSDMTTKRTIPNEPAKMVSIVDHPKSLENLKDALKKADQTALPEMISQWFGNHPMPEFGKSSVTFIYFDSTAVSATLELASQGTRAGYVMDKLMSDTGLFAVTLDRSELPERVAYTYRVDFVEERREILDPHCWSVTSRSGHPASSVVEADEKRGRIEVFRQIKPEKGDLLPRDVYVYLPPGYDKNVEQRYPVLYMHDGQNCWDDPVEPFGHGGWCVNLAADRLINGGKIEPFIGVGMANTANRMTEYGPGVNICSDKGHHYITLIKNVVKPLIEKRYRVKTGAKHAALMGSSMGGIISLQASVLNPELFGGAACLSPAFFFEDKSGRGYDYLLKEKGNVPVKLYLDNGTVGKGQDGAPQTRQMVKLLRSLGWKDGVDLEHFEDTGAVHNERAWRARLDKPLLFLFGK